MLEEDLLRRLLLTSTGRQAVVVGMYSVIIVLVRLQ